MTLKTLLLILHVVGVTFGAGGVLMLDFHLVRHLRGGRVTPIDLVLTRHISAFVKAGLIIVWLSGLLIIASAPDGPSAVLSNPKLQAKLVVVVVLTINALFVETLALPLLASNVGRPLFAGVAEARRAIVLTCGAVSTSSWLYPIALGLARELNGVVAARVILSYYAALMICLAAAVQVAGRLLDRAERASEAVADEAAREAGREAVLADHGPREVGHRFALLGSDGERHSFMVGMFAALAGRIDASRGVDSLFEIIAADEDLGRKFEALAPDEEARAAFARELGRVRGRTDEGAWVSVRDWHEALLGANANAMAARGGRKSEWRLSA